jgi:hypothetical protein
MKNKKKSKLVISVVLTIIIVAAAGIGVWKFIDLQNENNELQESLNTITEELTALREELINDPNGAIERSQNERTVAILEEVGKLYELPEGENPTIATVQDVDKLKDQPFFDGAQNGDQLIVFDDSATAILYRPSEKRLVKVGPINIEDSSEATATE